jgi:hypothetical protein
MQLAASPHEATIAKSCCVAKTLLIPSKTIGCRSAMTILMRRMLPLPNS